MASDPEALGTSAQGLLASMVPLARSGVFSNTILCMEAGMGAIWGKSGSTVGGAMHPTADCTRHCIRHILGLTHILHTGIPAMYILLALFRAVLFPGVTDIDTMAGGILIATDVEIVSTTKNERGMVSPKCCDECGVARTVSSISRKHRDTFQASCRDGSLQLKRRLNL